MVEICQGQKSKNEVLAESIERYKEMFMKTKVEFQKLMQVRSLRSPPSICCNDVQSGS